MIGLLLKMKKIRNGGTALLSKKDVSNLIINLFDAKKNLCPEDYKSVYSLYNQYQSDKSKKEMNISNYLEIANQIIEEFEKIAPYHLYSGQR